VKPSLQIRLSQHLALTPQLQQSIRLLQLSTLELHQEVGQMLEQNPFLEADDDGPAFEPLADRPAPDARGEDPQRDTHEVSDEPDSTDMAGFATTDSVDWEDSANGDDFDGIAEAKAGNALGDISHAIQKRVESEGMHVIKSLVGHGIGTEMHEEPQIPNYGEPGSGPTLVEGMTLAIEPMVNIGTDQIRMGSDHWAVYSADGSLAAHFEFTIAVGAEGPRILTPWHE